MTKARNVIIFTIMSLSWVHGYPKYETDNKGFVPSKADYFHSNGGDQLAMESRPANLTADASNDRPARFGFPTYSTDVQNYPQNVNNVVPGLYGPVKLDIGGLVLGTIVGLGAFFILPKLLHVVSTPYGGGGFKRSEEEGEQNGLGITELMTKVQDSLASYNVDSTACMQRALCSSIQSAVEKIGNQTANTFDNVVESVAKNDMVKTLIDGTDWKKVVETAEKGDSCSAVFAKCPFTVDSVVSAVAKYISTS